jgi:hypothetical protein
MTGPNDPNGMATAVAMLGGYGDLSLDADQQPELFADADDAPGSLSPVPERSGPGRPKGAKNRSTEQWRQFFLGKYQSPLIGLGETYTRSAEALARELFLTRETTHLAPGQTPIDTIASYDGDGHFRGMRYVVWDLERAFRLQQEARIGALPYVHQKLPQAIELTPPTRGLVATTWRCRCPRKSPRATSKESAG